MARRDGVNGAGGVFYYFSDHLKTASVITDAAGVTKAESDYYPWGGELQFVANDSNHYKFTGKERDNETQLDYFGARHYSNGLGRWVSADWSATPVPVPYADFGDPQSLNLYGYVGNLPTSKADLDGHDGPGVKEGVELSAANRALIKEAGERISTLGPAAALAAPSLGAMTFVVVGPKFEMPADGACGGDCTTFMPNTGGQVQQTQTAGSVARTAAQPGQLEETEPEPEPEPEPQVSTSGAGARKGTVPPSQRDPKRFFNRSDKKELKDRASGQCKTCDRRTIKAQASRKGTKHSRREGHAGHKKAWSKGGKTELSNGQWQCRGCNLDGGAQSK